MAIFGKYTKQQKTIWLHNQTPCVTGALPIGGRRGGTNGATITALTAGNCIIAADQLGNGNYNAAPQVTQTIAIGASGSTMTITRSANPSKAGQPITLNVIVAPVIPSVANSSYLKASTQPSAIPTGSVTFTDNGHLIATVPVDANGQASFSTSSLLAGNHAITANYPGDASNAAASATVIQAVDALIVPTLSACVFIAGVAAGNARTPSATQRLI